MINSSPPRKIPMGYKLSPPKGVLPRIQSFNKFTTQWNPPKRYRTKLTTQRIRVKGRRITLLTSQ